MNTKILITTLIVSFSMLLFSQHTFAGQKEHFLLTQKAAKKLDLTLDQQDKIAAIIKDKRSAMGAIKKDKKVYKMELNELMQKEYFDDQQVKKAIANIQSVNAKKMFCT